MKIAETLKTGVHIVYPNTVYASMQNFLFKGTYDECQKFIEEQK